VEVSPYELARAYGTIANGGREVIPFAIRKVVDRDNKVLENKEEAIKAKLSEKRKKGTINVIDPAAAQIMISMLRSVMSSGTGLYASIGRPAGGKTGTTNNWRDAWFVGFTPRVTTCIWMGYDQPGRSLGIGQSGGSVSAPVWGAYMKEAVRGTSVRNFPSYARLAEAEICARTGLLAGPNCPRVLKEVFIPGTVPKKTCELCANTEVTIDLQKKGPKENIIERQDKQILRQLKKDTDNSSILDTIGEDLLE
jgi:penicillin-binding protein 1A